MDRRTFLHLSLAGGIVAITDIGSPRTTSGKEASMIQLHIYLEAQPGKEHALEQVYRDKYVPAIVVQDGFVSTVLLKSSAAVRRYQIDIAFAAETKRLTWVASREHQEAWPAVEAVCNSISWQGFEVVE